MARGQLKKNPREIGRFRLFFSAFADREARVAQRVRNGNSPVLRCRSPGPEETSTARSLRTRRTRVTKTTGPESSPVPAPRPIREVTLAATRGRVP